MVPIKINIGMTLREYEENNAQRSLARRLRPPPVEAT
jgi:hypothetical protein